MPFNSQLKAHRQLEIKSQLAKADDAPDTFDHHLVEIYAYLSFMSIFVQDFEKAEVYAFLGKDINPSDTYINRVLVSSLLYLRKYQEAESIYLEFKDQIREADLTFSALILSDFEEFEKAGIGHPEIEKVRQILS